MSNKAAKNYEKILLGVAVLAAAAFIFLGVKKSSAADADFEPVRPGRGDDNPAVAGAEQVVAAKSSVTTDRTYERAEDEGREVDQFVGIPLFKKRDSPTDPSDPRRDPPIHPPIPNTWWLENHVPLVYADSPQRDHDNDGFTNLEEFEAKTDPNNGNAHPPLLNKLSYVKDDSYEWIVEYGFVSSGKWIPKFKDGQGGTNRVDFSAGLEPGDLFFSEPPMANRFKFDRIEERSEMNQRLNIEETKKYAIFSDEKPNKKAMGITYEIPERFPQAEIANHVQHDRTAVLDLKAIGMEGDEFRVEEYTTFSLPPGGEEKEYFLKKVTPEEIEVEYGPEGDRKTVTIPKG